MSRRTNSSVNNFKSLSIGLYIAIFIGIVIMAIMPILSGGNYDNRSKAVGAYPNRHTCSITHQCIQSDTGEYNSLLACQNECGLAPGPSSTPASYRCYNKAGKCVPNNQICNPSTNYGHGGCGIFDKCVPENAFCKNPLPTATLTPTPTPLCSKYKTDRECEYADNRTCRWVHCAYNNSNACFSSSVTNVQACIPTCSYFTSESQCTRNTTLGCVWHDCANGGAGACYVKQITEDVACNSDCVNKKTPTDCKSSSYCSWYACRYNNTGGCYQTGASDSVACGTACPTRLTDIACSAMKNRNGINTCIWYPCAHSGLGGCYQDGSPLSSACNASCLSINEKNTCKNTYRCTWSDCAYDNNGGCFMTDTPLNLTCHKKCEDLKSKLTCGVGCEWHDECGGKCTRVGTSIGSLCPKPTPTGALNPSSNGRTIIPNIATGETLPKSCHDICSANFQFCKSIGTDANASNHNIMSWTNSLFCFEGYQNPKPLNSDCSSKVSLKPSKNKLCTRDNLSYQPEWTNCLCTDQRVLNTFGKTTTVTDPSLTY